MRRTLAAIVMGLAAVLLATLPTQAGDPGVTPTQKETTLLSLANRERALHGAPPLTWDAGLCLAGRQHSREMADLGYFDHQSPSRGLESPADRWERYSPNPPAEYTIAENLFYGNKADVNWGHQSLMASEMHRDNILNPAFRHIGVGVYVAPSGEIWVTEMFLS